jgi:predicted nucleotide-binding protein (sugar kinase/HSP70/actin superfamily)
VIKNALHKVLKITNPAVLGEHIVVQGGTFRNPAVQKALEVLIGRPVTCPDLAELMGAYGAALTARDAYLNGANEASLFAGFEALELAGEPTRRELRCRGCENKCTVTKMVFPNGNSFVSGNRCEKVYSNGGKVERKGVNLPALKYKLLFERETQPKTPPVLTIGIPRVLNMFENYPFWNTLFVECGIQVRLSAPSSNNLYQDGAGFIMSENLCFPGKLVSGHIMDLVKAGVQRIFYPMVFYEKSEFVDANNSYNCPVVAGYPEVVRSAIDPEAVHGIPLDMPAITFRNRGLLEKACKEYLSGLGIPSGVFKRAFAKACQAQEAFKSRLVGLGEQAVRDSEAQQRPLILLMGRPYHIDALINHNIPELLSEAGVDVITEDCLPMEAAELKNRHVMTQWEYINRYFYAAHWAGEHKNVELVQLNSFGCGPDSFILDEVRAILAEHGKHPTVIRIDEIESAGSTKLRLRSMLEALRLADPRAHRPRSPRKTTRAYQPEDRERTLLVPDFSPFCSPPLVRPFMDLSYDIVQLPPADHNTVDVGLKYTNNEICYPGIITLGDIVKALQSGQYDLSRTAIGFSQTGGQCRATSYPSMIKKALVAAGFEDVPVVTLSTNLSVLNDQPGFRFNTRDYIYKAAVGMMFTDALSDMYYSTVQREKNKGQTQAVTDKYLRRFMDGSMPLTRSALLEGLAEAVADFNAIETRPVQAPRVGIVGEIYVKYNAFSNNHVVTWLMEQGLEVVMPHFFEFFDSGFVISEHAVKTHIEKRDMYWVLNYLGQKLAAFYLHQFDAVLQGYQRYRPHHSIYSVAGFAEEILSLNHQYGEGWLIAGEISALVSDGVQNVLCLQPFGCIANHVIAKGVQKRLQGKYPQLNLLFLDADAGVSEANFFNRLYFFVNQAKKPAIGLGAVGDYYPPAPTPAATNG